MGTNYYIRSDICKTCFRYEELHIGKSSCGWHFSLHIIPELGIKDLNDWKKLFVSENTKIVDEYGDELTTDEMLDIITNRKWPSDEPIDERFLIENSAEVGINGLLAHTQSPYRKVIRTDGPYDLIEGDFC